MAKFNKIIIENSEKKLIKKFIENLKKRILKKTQKKQRFSMVLTGGNSIKKIYKELSKNKSIPWKKIDFFISDERYINSKSRFSNINNCKKKLLNKIKVKKNQIYFISTNKKSLEKDCIEYEKKIKSYFFNKRIFFDLVILSLGEDGHVASLFKENVKSNSNSYVGFVKRNDFKRITLTTKSLNNSNEIFVWAIGKNKEFILKKIFVHKKKYPISFLKPKGNLLLYTDNKIRKFIQQ